jgi:hypothetical protein
LVAPKRVLAVVDELAGEEGAVVDEVRGFEGLVARRSDDVALRAAPAVCGDPSALPVIRELDRLFDEVLVFDADEPVERVPGEASAARPSWPTARGGPRLEER